MNQGTKRIFFLVSALAIAAAFAASTTTFDALVATTFNKITITQPASGATLTIPNGITMTGPASSGTVMTIGNTETVTGPKTFGSAGSVGRLKIAGTTSGTITLDAAAVAGTNTLTLPAATDTLVGRATTDTLTNKTISGASNTLSNVNLASQVTGILPLANAGTGGAVAMVATDQSVTNTTTLTDSTAAQIALGTGTYFIETRELIGSSDFTNAGSKSAVAFTGTMSITEAGVERGGAAATVPQNVAPSWGQTTDTLTTSIGANGSSFYTHRWAVIVVTGAGTIKIQFAQNTAVAAQTATIIAGSYIKAVKLQ